MFGVLARNRALFTATAATHTAFTRPVAGYRGSFIRAVKGVRDSFLRHILASLPLVSAFTWLYHPLTLKTTVRRHHGTTTEEEAEHSARR
jgi:hypothetical protein